MPRLPTPGGDNGIWDDLLVEYLLVSHDASGVVKPEAMSAATAAAAAAAANVAALETRVATLEGSVAAAGNALPFVAQTGTTSAYGWPGCVATNRPTNFSSSTTPQALATGIIYCNPFPLADGADFALLGFRISAAAAAGGTALMALLKCNASWQPTSRLYLSSAIATTATGAQEITTGLPASQEPGNYMTAILFLGNVTGLALTNFFYSVPGLSVVGGATAGILTAIRSNATNLTTIPNPPTDLIAVESTVPGDSLRGICWTRIGAPVVVVPPPPPPPPGGGTIRYITPTSSTSALHTALAASANGDKVVLQNGNYAQQTFAKVAASSARITIEGASRTGVTVQGMVMDGGLGGSQYLTIRNLTIAGTIAGAANLKSGILFYGSTVHHNLVENCTIQPTSGPSTDSTPMVSCRFGTHDIEISNCTLNGELTRGGQSRCVMIYGDNTLAETNWPHDIYVHHCDIYGPAGDNINIHGGYAIRIEDNSRIGRLQDNGDHNDGIQCSSGRQIWIKRNTFQDASPWGGNSCIVLNSQVLSAGGPQFVTSDVIIDGNTALAWGGDGIGLAGVRGTLSIINNTFQNMGSNPDPTYQNYGLTLWGGGPPTVAGAANALQNENCNSSTVHGNNFGIGCIYKRPECTDNSTAIAAVNTCTG